jgi:aminopeptidase-like protein
MSDVAATGQYMYDLVRELYPICRSITGEGVRASLRCIADRIPLDIQEVPTGTPVLDWTVPDEWNIRDAFVADASGHRVIDFRRSNLHVVSYSEPVRARMTLEQLRPRLHSLPDRPDSIPYRTSYYERTWGFCLRHRELEALLPGDYEVVVDSTIEPGQLTFGECLLRGEVDDEVLVSAHVCHPSLCNDNLSGIAVAAALATTMQEVPHRYTYRFLFIPGTIGSIAWLATHEDVVGRIRHGVVLTGLGDGAPLRYKRSRRGNALIDRAFAHVLHQKAPGSNVVDFEPYGYDERQYCSPGYDLPVGRLMRSPNGEYPEYHTSADDLNFVTCEALHGALTACLKVFDVIEHDRYCVNLRPKGEPQLGRRGLYRGLAGSGRLPGCELAMLWVLNQSDGSHSLLEIAERSGLSFDVIHEAAALLKEHGLLEHSCKREGTT